MLKYCLVISFFISYNSSAQSPIQNKIDTLLVQLDSFKNSGLYDEYYAAIRSYEKWCLKNDYHDNAYNKDSLYNWLPQNRTDSLCYRRAKMYYAHIIKKSGDLYRALDNYLTAHRHGESIGYNDQWSWYIENDIGGLYSRIGDYDKAVYFYLTCSNTESGKKRLSRLYKSIGSAYYWIDNVDKSQKYLTRALTIAEEIREYKTLCSANRQLAEISLQAADYKNFHMFFDSAEHALSHLINQKDYSSRFAAMTNLFADYLYRIGKYKDAIDKYKEVVPLYEQLYRGTKVREMAKLYERIGRCYLKTTNLNECKSAILKGYKWLLPNAEGGKIPAEGILYPEIILADLLKLHVKYYNACFQNVGKYAVLDTAVVLCDRAMSIYNEYYSEISSYESQLKLSDDRKEIINSAATASYALYEKTNDSKYLDQMEKYFGFSKGSVFRNKRLFYDSYTNMSISEKHFFDSLTTKLSEYYSNTNPDTSDDIAFYTSLSKIDALKTKSLYKNPRPEVVDNPYIEYLVTDNNVFVMSNVGLPKILKLALSKDDLVVMKDSLDYFLSEKKSNFNHLLTRLYDELIPWNISDLSMLTIIPDDLLTNIPFDLFMSEGSYLIEKVPISYRYCNQVDNTRDNTSRSLDELLWVSPNYSSVGDSHTEERAGQPLALTSGASELDVLESLSNIDIYKHEQISSDRLFNSISTVDAFHFSGHAFSDRSNACLLLQNDTIIEKVNYSQISSVKNNLGMVFLSACDTGNGEQVLGEGKLNLASAFLGAGAQSVFYTLWNINDHTTAEIVDDVYDNLVQGMQKDVALRNAKLKYLTTADPLRKHPYYWASLKAEGNMSSLDIKNKHNTLVLILTTLFSIIILWKLKSFIRLL